MLKLSISEKNKLDLKFESDNYQLMKDLKIFFTKKFPGYKFSPKYKAGIWNGDICLIDCIRKTMLYGFLYDVLKFKNEKYKNEEFIFSDEVKLLFKGTKLDIISDLKWNPRDYQLDCINKAIEMKKGILKVATGRR